MMNIRQLQTPCYIINGDDYRRNILSFRREFESRWEGEVILEVTVGMMVGAGTSISAMIFGWMPSKNVASIPISILSAASARTRSLPGTASMWA